MTKITAALVKELREKTGGGMMDCKLALNECGGDIESATDWLRSKGLAAAQKKSSRIAAEGLIGVHISDSHGTLIEINSETDFVARNAEFQKFVRETVQLATDQNCDFNSLKSTTFSAGGKTVNEHLTDLISKIGENLSIRRVASLSIKKGVLASYVHNSVADNLGKIGVLVGLESDIDEKKLATLGKQLAMHIAASRPKSVSREKIKQSDLDRERAILMEQAQESGKPDSIVEKMVEGRMNKFFEDVCLLEQTFIIDGESKISKVISELEKQEGNTINIAGFEVFVLGEGIKKKEEDFAAEVSAVAEK